MHTVSPRQLDSRACGHLTQHLHPWIVDALAEYACRVGCDVEVGA